MIKTAPGFEYYKDMEMVYKPHQERLIACLKHAAAFLELVVPHLGEPDTPNQKMAQEIADEARRLLLRSTADGNLNGVQTGVRNE